MRLLTALALTTIVIFSGCDTAKDDTTKNDDGGNGAAPATTPEGAYALSQDNMSVTFVGEKPNGESHRGRFETLSGHMKFNADNLDECSVQVTIDMDSLWSDAQGLTNHLKQNDFFNVVEYPESKFVSTQFTHVEEDTYNILGNLTIRDVTKEVTFPAIITQKDDALNLTIEYSLKRTDFNVNFKPDQVNDMVPLKIAINAKQE
ncbi:MAG: YceI family protein [Pirellulales bacterium]|nr:YceI family protein [Pirellulales bacterium]